MKKLLVVVDYQNDFVNGALGFSGAETLESGIFSAVRQTLAEGGYVLFTRDTHPEKYLETREGKHLPIPHCIIGTPGHALFGSLHHYEQTPVPHVLLLNKPTFGCYAIGEAAEKLCGGAPDEVSICGLVTDICVLANAILLHTALPDAKVCVLQKLTGSGNAVGAAAALELMRAMGIEISS